MKYFQITFVPCKKILYLLFVMQHDLETCLLLSNGDQFNFFIILFHLALEFPQNYCDLVI